VSEGRIDSGLVELCDFFAPRKECGESLVLGTIVRTEGSTYRKAGARILFSESRDSSGLLSGGCLEADLRERAACVLRSGKPERAIFDSRISDDPIWGTRLGCEGANHIWLQPVVSPATLPPALLLCGAGPDAIPVAQFGALLGWKVTIDAMYLGALSTDGPSYIGLLGPASRRARLLKEAGPMLEAVAGRIRGPVGLDIGAKTPAGIALAIVAQIHAVLGFHEGSPGQGTF
jgi:xanthine/CO dehydrogenase XdhC/CoxF family maturation factor